MNTHCAIVRLMKLVTALLLAACGSPDAPPEPAPAPRLDLGSCSLEITSPLLGGDRPPTTVTEVTPGGAQLSYWGDKIGGKEGLVITCASAQSSVSFTAREQTRATLPPAPRKYEVSSLDVVQVDGRVKEGRLAMTTGTFEITALDETHIAGSFDLRTLFSHEASRISANVKGRFDFKCPHAPCRKVQR